MSKQGMVDPFGYRDFPGGGGAGRLSDSGVKCYGELMSAEVYFHRPRN